MAEPQRNHPAAREWLIVFALLAAYWFMATSISRHKSPGFDEPFHLTAGYSYWTTGDYRLHPENGILPQRWAALPLLFSDVKFPSLDQNDWRLSSVASLSHQFFYDVGNDSDRMLWCGRAMIALLGVGLGLVVYLWSRQLFGVTGGLISLTVFAFCPTMLAHGSMVTSDMALALFLTATLWCWWNLLRRISPGALIASSLLMGALLLSKASAVLVLPVLALMIVIRLTLSVPFSQRTKQLFAWLAVLAINLIVATFLIWAAYGFRYSAFKESQPNRDQLCEPWETLWEKPNLTSSTIQFARDHHLLPEAYLYGFAYVVTHADNRVAFLNGEYRLHGWRTFFPYCFAVKTPLPLFAILALGGLPVFVRWRSSRASIGQDLHRVAPLFALLAVYWAFAISSHLNIGHRHILPVYPPLYVLAGASAVWLRNRNRWGTVLVSVALLLFVVESIRIRPHYLAYFNQLAGGPRQGYRHLVDGSLDWGQDLPSLKRWLDRERRDAQKQTSVYFSYFGSADPTHYGIDATQLPSFFDSWRKRELVPLRGGIYCISATMLQSIYPAFGGLWTKAYEDKYQTVIALMRRLDQATDPRAREALLREYGSEFWNNQFALFDQLRFARLCAFLRHREPDDEVGFSILIYRLSDEEIHQAAYGTPTEMEVRSSITDEVKSLAPPPVPR